MPSKSIVREKPWEWGLLQTHSADIGHNRPTATQGHRDCHLSTGVREGANLPAFNLQYTLASQNLQNGFFATDHPSLILQNQGARMAANDAPWIDHHLHAIHLHLLTGALGRDWLFLRIRQCDGELLRSTRF